MGFAGALAVFDAALRLGADHTACRSCCGVGVPASPRHAGHFITPMAPRRIPRVLGTRADDRSRTADPTPAA
jgi:hypothetical protein